MIMIVATIANSIHENRRRRTMRDESAVDRGLFHRNRRPGGNEQTTIAVKQSTITARRGRWLIHLAVVSFGIFFTRP